MRVLTQKSYLLPEDFLSDNEMKDLLSSSKLILMPLERRLEALRLSKTSSRIDPLPDDEMSKSELKSFNDILKSIQIYNNIHNKALRKYLEVTHNIEARMGQQIIKIFKSRMKKMPHKNANIVMFDILNKEFMIYLQKNENKDKNYIFTIDLITLAGFLNLENFLKEILQHVNDAATRDSIYRYFRAALDRSPMITEEGNYTHSILDVRSSSVQKSKILNDKQKQSIVNAILTNNIEEFTNTLLQISELDRLFIVRNFIFNITADNGFEFTGNLLSALTEMGATELLEALRKTGAIDDLELNIKLEETKEKIATMQNISDRARDIVSVEVYPDRYEHFKDLTKKRDLLKKATLDQTSSSKLHTKEQQKHLGKG